MIVSVITLGCKVNKYESDALILKLKNIGIDAVDKLEAADVFVINTCAVTAEAEKKSRQMIAKCRKLNSEAKILVCGCASQLNQEQFFDKNVEYILGTANKMQIVDLIKSFDFSSKNINKIEDLPLIYQDDMRAMQSRNRAYIKIQDGCNNFCSYCIIPYLRGRSRSRSLQSIMEEAKSLDETIKEIVLTGINVTDFKIDGEKGLLKLMQELDKLGKRLRLSSLEEGLIDEDFVKGLKALKNFCPHFHLSLQSGSDSVLKRMNRHYTSAQFSSSVDTIRKYFPSAGITTDVIVGFADESDNEFEETYALIEKIRFSQIHIFKYSVREGTMSAKMFKDLPFAIKQHRLERLEALNEKLKNEFINKNKFGQVLIEEKQQKYYVGYTKNYIKCYIESDEISVNDIVEVKIGERFKDGAKAEVIKN